MTRRAVISGLLPLLREGDSYLILCHKSPDGDAVGSAEALRLLLAGLGKQAVCACADPLPEYLRFIPEIPFLCCPTPDCLPEYKILLTVDTADPSLLGGLAPLGESAFIKIDHHRSGKSYGKHEYTDPAAAATGEILFSLAKEADLLTPGRGGRALHRHRLGHRLSPLQQHNGRHPFRRRFAFAGRRKAGAYQPAAFLKTSLFPV